MAYQESLTEAQNLNDRQVSQVLLDKHRLVYRSYKKRLSLSLYTVFPINAMRCYSIETFIRNFIFSTRAYLGINYEKEIPPISYRRASFKQNTWRYCF